MTRPISDILNGTRRELLPMPWSDYLKFPGLNGSVIVHGRKSMLHLKYAWDCGDEDSDAMCYGRMVHCLLFEPAEFERRYRAWNGTRRGNDYELFCAEAARHDAEVVRANGQYSLDEAVTAARSFLTNERVRELIASGQAEQTVLAVEHGLQCKGRLDWVSTSEHVLTDLKNATRVEPDPFGRAFFNYGYDMKLGLYKRWLEAVTGQRWPVEVIVLESKPPHDVAVVPIPDAVLDSGVEKGMDIIQRVRQSIETDQWLGVSDGGTYPLNVPYYEMAEETEEYQGD